jgi:hypothetical protein
MLSYAVVVKHSVRVSAISLLSLVLLVTTPVHAEDTQVNAVVCGGMQGASLTVEQPKSDSLTASSPIAFQGAVSNATQIDVTVDDNYDSTLPINPNQPTYQILINLTTGTHTVKLTANDICHVQNAVQTVVITYQPVITTSDGAQVESSTSSGVAIGDTQPALTENSQQSSFNGSTIPVIGPFVGFLKQLWRVLDFDTTVRPGTIITGIMSIIFSILGICLITFGASVASLFKWAAIWVDRTKMGRRRFDILLRIIGLILIIWALSL